MINSSEDWSIEKANYIILSLYKEYSKLFLKTDITLEQKEFYRCQMIKLKQDLLSFDEANIIFNSKNLYAPRLQEIQQNNNLDNVSLKC